jgi:dihydroorotate dehydrogenase (fumarate)
MSVEDFVDVSTTIAGMRLEYPIFNASGPLCTTERDLRDIGESYSGAILSKSCTLVARSGNLEPRYKEFGDQQNSINSMGLPNLGYQEYTRILPALKTYGKPVIASISGLTPEDSVVIAKSFNNTGIDAIELNLSCPNVIGKPQIGYDFEASRKLISKVTKVSGLPIGVKLPPFFDISHIKEMAGVLNNSGISFVTCINSPGNGLVIDIETESTVIHPREGFGGIGGPCIKPFGLANVRKFRELLDPKISIIGVGGICSGADVFEYILCGADAVQIGTCFMQKGTSAFKTLVCEFLEIVSEKGYRSVQEFKGKLKTTLPSPFPDS